MNKPVQAGVPEDVKRVKWLQALQGERRDFVEAGVPVAPKR
jgi:hypothetical protein